MGSLFRSEEMALYQLILHSDTSYECVLKLGEIGVLQFCDLNLNLNTFQRKFIDKVRRCDEMERKLRYFYMEMQNDGIPLKNYSEESVKNASQNCEMNELEVQIDSLELELRTINENAKELKCICLKLTELRHILRKIHELNAKFDEDAIENGNDDIRAAVISHDRLPSFERMLRRTLHGNNLYYHQTLIIHPMVEDCESGEFVNKSVFITFCHGDEIRMRIEKICAGFHIILHPFPIGSIDRQNMDIKIMKRIVDLNMAIQQIHDYRRRLLITVAKNLNDWSIQVGKIKAIYHTINKFNVNTMKNFLIAECWIPLLDIETVQTVLKHAARATATTQCQPIIMPILNRLQTFDKPPTYFITNKFTKPFQMLIESYGVANYREMNPAPYTIVTIPFLFAVMFGDFGHGILIVLFALWMILRKKSFVMQKNANNEVSDIFAKPQHFISFHFFSFFLCVWI